MAFVRRVIKRLTYLLTYLLTYNHAAVNQYSKQTRNNALVMLQIHACGTHTDI